MAISLYLFMILVTARIWLIAAGMCNITAGCPNEIKVNWMSIPPYIYRTNKADGLGIEVNGTLKIIVEDLIRKCCGSCVSFTYTEPANDSITLNARIGQNSSDLSLPVYGVATTTARKMYPYYPVINSPGIIYIQKLSTVVQENVLLTSLSKSWPIVVLILIFAVLSGFVIWTLDSRANPKDFPHFFVPGIWDGFWWAFVSMTTVGYGDKAPVTFFSRVFAFFWCLIGMVIISIFTSTLSTSLTSESLKKVTTLYGKKLVALNNSKEHQYGTSQNAVILPVVSIAEMLKQFTDENPNSTVNGGLIDAYVAGFDASLFADSAYMKFSHVEEHDFTYGFIASNDLTNSTEITKCLRRELSSAEENIFYLIQQNMVPLPKPNDTSTPVKIIDRDSHEFRMTCIISAAAFAILYFFAVIWYCLYYKPKKAKDPPPYKDIERSFPSGTLYGDVVISQFFDIEHLMVKEVMEFYHQFKVKIEHMRMTYVEDYKKPTIPLPAEVDLGDTWLFHDIYNSEKEPVKEKKETFMTPEPPTYTETKSATCDDFEDFGSKTKFFKKEDMVMDYMEESDDDIENLYISAVDLKGKKVK